MTSRLPLTILIMVLIACKASSTTTHETDPKPPGLPEAPTAAAAGPEVRVDRRVELLSVVQRLIGAPEYLRTPATRYTAAIDATFARFADHPAVAATRELRARHGISYDAPMWLAVALDDSLALQAAPNDARYAGVDLDDYLGKLRDLDTASGFGALLQQHADYIGRVEQRVREAIAKEDPVAWFDGFFGARPGMRFVVVPGLLTGTFNYGPYTETALYQVLGIARVDFDELPVMDDAMIELVIHEMAHGYVNPLLARHHAALAPHGERLFAQVADAMTKQAYPSWQIMLNEQVVRAVTALYLRERKGAAAGEAAIARERARSFLWTRPLTDLLAAYAGKRERFRDLDAFMPHIVELFASQP